MNQTTTDAQAQTPPFHPRAAAATVADLMRPPLTTAGQSDHVAAAVYLMKHAGTTALMVTDTQTGQPAGIITQADVTRAIAEGKDLNDVRVHAVMTTRPAITTTTNIRDAAKIMAARHYRHLPVTGDAGLLGVIDITDVCRALNNAEDLAGKVAGSAGADRCPHRLQKVADARTDAVEQRLWPTAPGSLPDPGTVPSVTLHTVSA